MESSAWIMLMGSDSVCRLMSQHGAHSEFCTATVSSCLDLDSLRSIWIQPVTWTIWMLSRPVNP
eukprot:599228-Rhodomonas_salina.1